MLTVTGIHTYYDTDHILQGLSLHVTEGHIVAVLGRNGAGKTTLVRSILGLTPPRSGSIVFDGHELTRLAPYRIARLGIGLVPQGRRIFPSLTVRENLMMGLRAGASGPWTLQRLFDIFPILRERSDASGGTLSGGEQQMLACARALIANPRLLVLDEPSEGLAPQKVRELGEVIGEFRKAGQSVLLVEQKVGFALSHADQVYVLAKGEIAFAGAPSELQNDRDLLERLLGVAPSTHGRTT